MCLEDIFLCPSYDSRFHISLTSIHYCFYNFKLLKIHSPNSSAHGLLQEKCKFNIDIFEVDIKKATSTLAYLGRKVYLSRFYDKREIRSFKCFTTSEVRNVYSNQHKIVVRRVEKCTEIIPK